MTVLFDRVNLDQDKVILSCGWKAAALYYFLWRRGRITEEELNSYCGLCDKCLGTGFWDQYGRRDAACPKCNGSKQSKFIGLTEPIIPEIPFSGGSMGMGFPAAVGFALAKKLKGERGTIYCLMSDGEMQCGTTWESALIASRYNLDNLKVIVDRNFFQAMGKTEDILPIDYADSLKSKWEFFGWQVDECDGHNFEGLWWVVHQSYSATPSVAICKTTKGKGVSFMENNNDFHYLHINKEDYEKAKKELFQ
mgnify:CR=1 FL=1